jgi:translation initiation factor IF-2
MSGSKSALHNKGRQKKHKKASIGKKDYIPAKAALQQRLEIVLKCDTSGCAEAIIAAISSLNQPAVEINIISSGLGAVNKSDIFMAETGSRLV